MSKKEKKQTLDPVNGRVFVVPLTGEVQTNSGLILKEAQDKPEIGFILLVDKNDDHHLNKNLNVGTRIIFNRFSGQEVEIFLGKKCLVINKESIYGVYKEI